MKDNRNGGLNTGGIHWYGSVFGIVASTASLVLVQVLNLRILRNKLESQTDWWNL